MRRSQGGHGVGGVTSAHDDCVASIASVGIQFKSKPAVIR